MYGDAYTDEYGFPITSNVTDGGSGVAPFSAAFSPALSNITAGQTAPAQAGTFPIENGMIVPQQGAQAPSYSGAKDFQSLLRYWQSQHPASNPDIDGLIRFLGQNGVSATRATHAGNQPSDDKITINGQMFDLGSSLGGPGATWFSDVAPMGQDSPTPIDASYLAPFSEAFSAGSLATQPSYTAPKPFSYAEFQAPTADSILQDPSYQFRLDQGAKALEASAAGRGVLNTGGTLKDLLGYGQNFASQEYGNIYGRNLDTWKANQNNALQSYATNYGVGRDTYNALVDQSNEAYNRAWNQYLDRKNTFYSNQNNPYQKLYGLSSLGLNAAGS